MKASQTIRHALTRTSRWLAGAVLLAALASVVVPVAAHAAPSYLAEQTTAETCGASTRGAGQMDASGWLYLACDQSDSGATFPSVHLFDAGGVLQRMVAVPWTITSAAPSPDGTIIYVARWNDHTLYRLVGSRSTGYTLDTTWKLENLPAGGVRNAGALVRGEYVATDSLGDLYVTSGTWTNPANGLADYTDRWDPTRAGTTIAKTIVKFHPTGAYVTNFGSVANAGSDANAWDAGVAYTQWTGLAVTADGGRVFAADENNSRVHRFDLQGDGSYRVQSAFGNTRSTNADRGGHCYDAGLLAAPYDVALSRNGELLVVNTSCRFTSKNARVQSGDVALYSIEIQRFGQDGSSRGVIHAVSPNTHFDSDLQETAPWPVHGISLDCTGAIHLPQANIKLTPSPGWSDAGAGGAGPLGSTASCVSAGAPAGGVAGGPDTVKPVVDTFTAAQVGTSLDVTITVRAHDNVGVTDYHLYDAATDRGWGFAATTKLTVAGYGTRVLNVQVRDAADNVSEWVPVTVTLTAPGTGAAKGTAAPATTAAAAHPAGIVPVATSAVSAAAPVIRAVKLPPSTTTGHISAVVAASDPNGGVLRVRIAGENGRWGALRPVGTVAITLSRGTGWKGVFVQVVDAAGNHSRIWFQPVLSAPNTVSWQRGSQGADHLTGTPRADAIDLSRYDSKVDHVSCGRGIDSVLLQPEDIAAADCEHVVRLHTPTS